MKKVNIGTRDSLLAVTQSTLTKNEITSKSGIEFELIKIKTQGDQQVDKPLWQLDGKDFFTKELDSLLINKEIDMVIHSYKDLGSERPNGIELAAITKREYPNDILLIKNTTISKLSQINELCVGTSSPRRIQNCESSLQEFLPHLALGSQIKCKMLRGNVNTRIQKLKDDEYDAIILAHAGLERLAQHKDSRVVLENLLEGLNFMILPQKSFPSSAAQGALAIEVHESCTDDLRKSIASVHCKKTEEAIAQERKSFNAFGGGCHLAVGVHVKSLYDYYVKIEKGHHNKHEVNSLSLEGYDYKSLKGKSLYTVIGEDDFLLTKAPIVNKTSGENIFVTSKNCFHAIGDHSSLWSGGSKSTLSLVKDGYWVNGSAEGFGHEEVQKYKDSISVQIMLNSKKWIVLSHENAKSCVGEVLPSYKHSINQDANTIAKEKIFSSDIIYWSSIIQYNLYIEKYPELKDKIHACGLGKTYSELLKIGLSPVPTIDIQHLEAVIS